MKGIHQTPLLLTAMACLASTAYSATTAYRNLILGDNPIVYYEFDETSGTAADNLGSGGATNDGTIVGTVTVGQSSFTHGGTAYDFGGGRVTAAAFSTLTEWTVEAWINWDSAKTSGSNIFGNDQTGANNDVLFGIRPEEGAAGVAAGHLAIVQQGAAMTGRDVKSASLTHSVWHHVVATGSMTTGEIKLYVDGALVPGAMDSSSDPFSGTTMNGHQFAVGAARFVVDAGTRPFDGLIDEFALYGTVLDATSIEAHYNAGIAPIAGPSAAKLTNLNYDAGDGSAAVTLKGAPGTRYKLVEADDLDFTAPPDPIPLTGATVGTLDGNEVVADGSGDATVQFNLGTSKDATFLRAVTVP